MFLVTAAAGKSGLAVIRALACNKVEIRALVRRQEHVPMLQALGVSDVVVGEMRERETLARALAGVTAVYHICPAVQPDEAAIGIGLIAAAREAGVARFVYHSVLHPQISALIHHAQKLRVEGELISSGLNYTILQPASYMQNVLESLPRIVEQGIYATMYGLDARMSLVDLDDVGKVAARVLTEPGHQAASYEPLRPGSAHRRCHGGYPVRRAGPFRARGKLPPRPMGSPCPRRGTRRLLGHRLTRHVPLLRRAWFRRQSQRPRLSAPSPAHHVCRLCREGAARTGIRVLAMDGSLSLYLISLLCPSIIWWVICHERHL